MRGETDLQRRRRGVLAGYAIGMELKGTVFLASSVLSGVCMRSIEDSRPMVVALSSLLLEDELTWEVEPVHQVIGGSASRRLGQSDAFAQSDHQRVSCEEKRG